MKKIKTLVVKFENNLTPKMVPAFRGAIIEKVGRSHILFHHHQNDREVLYQYPLIQYKSLHKKSAIVCLGDGANEMYRLFNQPDLRVKIQDQNVDLVLDEMQIKNFTVQFVEDAIKYRLVNWLGLNEKNYEDFKKLSGAIQKVELLEKILKSNILSFAKGIEWTIDSEIKLQIIEITDQRIIRFKGKPVLAFDLLFQCNINLPNFIGLGKSASHGYGMINSTQK